MSEKNQKLINRPALRRMSRRLKILVLGAVILIVCAIVGLVFYINQTKKQDQVVKVEPPKLTAVQQSEYLAQKGDYEGAQKIIADQIAEAKNNTATGAQKTSTITGLYLQQATIALNADNSADAKKYAQEAESLQPTANTASLLGYIAALAGDKDAAKQYYEKAIVRLDKNAESYNTSLQDYQHRLQELSQ